MLRSDIFVVSSLLDSCSFDQVLISDDKNVKACGVKVIQVGGGGVSVTPSSVLVVENFLPEDFTMATFENITQNQEWTTVLPHHKKFYDEWKMQQGNGDENGSKMIKAFREDRGGFPGVRTNLTQAYEHALKEKLESLDLEKMMGLENKLKREWSSKDSFFGNVCYHPESLGLSQKAPHTDQGFVGKKMSQLAIVHYLNPSFQGTGGTSFYKETSSGASRFLFNDCQFLKAKAKELDLKPGTTQYLEATSCHCRFSTADCSSYPWYAQKIQTGEYASASTPHYELLLHVPYKFNSAVIYDAQQLHSAYIDADTLKHLNCYASEGRVTSNIFII